MSGLLSFAVPRQSNSKSRYSSCRLVCDSGYSTSSHRPHSVFRRLDHLRPLLENPRQMHRPSTRHRRQTTDRRHPTRRCLPPRRTCETVSHRAAHRAARWDSLDLRCQHWMSDQWCARHLSAHLPHSVSYFEFSIPGG